MSHDGRGISVGLLVAYFLSAFMKLECGVEVMVLPEASLLLEWQGRRSYVLRCWWGCGGMLRTVGRSGKSAPKLASGSQLTKQSCFSRLRDIV